MLDVIGEGQSGWSMKIKCGGGDHVLLVSNMSLICSGSRATLQRHIGSSQCPVPTLLCVLNIHPGPEISTCVMIE